MPKVEYSSPTRCATVVLPVPGLPVNTKCGEGRTTFIPLPARSCSTRWRATSWCTTSFTGAKPTKLFNASSTSLVLVRTGTICCAVSGILVVNRVIGPPSYMSKTLTFSSVSSAMNSGSGISASSSPQPPQASSPSPSDFLMPFSSSRIPVITGRAL